VIAEFTISHEEEGFRAIQRRLLRLAPAGEILVGIETSYNVIVDFLLDAGFEVACIHPNQIHGDRKQVSSSGAKSDRSDALLIARHLINNEDGLRTFKPDSEETVALRQLVAERQAIVKEETSACNRLGSLLERYLPAALGLFSSYKSKIYRAFLRAFPNQEALEAASLEDFRAFLVEQRYCKKVVAEDILASKKNAPAGARGLLGEVGSTCILAEVDKIEALCSISKRLEKEMKKTLDAHADAEIFKSFPGADTVMASRLLVSFGDDRTRFPHAESMASLIGIVPVSKASGKSKTVHFRRACNREGRHTFHLFTNLTRASTPWAQDRYLALREGGKSHAHALRVLGRSWLRIIHACWKSRTLYDPGRTASRAPRKGALR